MVYWSPVDADTRQVWQVALGRDVYALKLDHNGANDNRLTKEFGELRALKTHFESYDKLGLITPVYLSPSGASHITEYLN